MYDDDTDTEPIDDKFETTSEKSFLEAIRDGLNLIETENNNLTASVAPQASFPTAATASESADDGEEEISIIDFLLNGEKIFGSTTVNPLDTVTLPSSNGGAPFTNSPMHIQPILPEEMKNGTMKFALLPMSLYNMVKEDGTIVFEGNNGTQIKARTPIVGINAEEVETTTDSVEEIPTTLALLEDDEMKTTSGSTGTTNLITDTSTARIYADIPSTFETASAETATIASIESRENLFVNQTTVSNRTESSTTTVTHRNKDKKIPETTTTAMPIATMEYTTTGITSNETASKFVATTIELEASASTIVTSTESANHLTTTHPRVVIDSNPSILETDLSYDYSEPTLPPSLPNLKIIPFLPTDAVKPAETISRQKINFNENKSKISNNYYLSNSNPYSNGASSSLHSSQNYSPFSGKPATEKYPVYNGEVQLAGDRLDYDGYNSASEIRIPNVDYSNVYSISGIGSNNAFNVISAGAPAVHGGVNSKLEFESFKQQAHPKPPPKNSIPTTTNKNLLTINRFETPYSDLVQVQRPRPSISPRPSDNFSYNNPVPNKYGDTYLAPYQREPVFDEDYALLNESPNEHATGDGGVEPPKPLFSYTGKNNFIPPLQTEGWFSIATRECAKK